MIQTLRPPELMLFGQAETGIAHEVAYRFRRIGRLTTSYSLFEAICRAENPTDFFTTLAIDLCNRYPAFKTSLENVISNNRELVSAESLVQDPLNYVHFVGSVFVVIDECEDASSSGFRAGGNTLLCFPCAPPIRTTLEFLHNHYVSSRGRLHSPRRHLPAYCRWTTASWQLPWMKTFSPTCMQSFARLSLTITVPSW